MAAFSNEWRQIDRWLNEGGAGNRADAHAQQTSRSLQP
jgi:hypothetical protein